VRVLSLSDAKPVRGISRPAEFVSLDRSLLYAGTEEKTDSNHESLDREANRATTHHSQTQRC
jgi:hypothetical protein